MYIYSAYAYYRPATKPVILSSITRLSRPLSNINTPAVKLQADMPGTRGRKLPTDPNIGRYKLHLITPPVEPPVNLEEREREKKEEGILLFHVQFPFEFNVLFPLAWLHPCATRVALSSREERRGRSVPGIRVCRRRTVFFPFPRHSGGNTSRSVRQGAEISSNGFPVW